MRKFLVTVNGEQYEVVVKETVGEGQQATPAPAFSKPAPAQAPAIAPKAPAPAPKPAAPVAAPKPTAGESSITAPMPGTILAIKVVAGQAVVGGEVLMTLEAMKMENEIIAPEDGTVGEVFVSVGQSVNTGDVLLNLA